MKTSTILTAAIVAGVILSIGSETLADKKGNFSQTRTNSEGQKYTTVYYGNGTTFTKSTRRDGSCCDTSPGRWRRENGRICESYENWRGGATWCH